MTNPWPSLRRILAWRETLLGIVARVAPERRVGARVKRRQLQLMSPAYRGGCVGALLVLMAFFAALGVLIVVDGKGRAWGGVVFLACVGLIFLWLAMLMLRQPRTTLDGTILALKLPLRRERFCDLAQVDAARVTFGVAEVGSGSGSMGAMRTCELRLEGGGDLALLNVRPGFRWPRPEDLRSLAAALAANPNPAAVAPAIATLDELARNRGRPPAKA